MANFAISNSDTASQQALSTAYKSLIMAGASSGTSLRRIRVYDLMFGTNGTPANNELEYDVSRYTVVGTVTAQTARKLDPADGVALGVYSQNATAEPTVTATSSLFYAGVNQQATVRWAAVDRESELLIPATDANGLAFRAQSAAYTGKATAMAYIRE